MKPSAPCGGKLATPCNGGSRDGRLNKWHHAVHQVTGGMALHFNRATAVDLRKWAAKLRTVADEMDVASLDAPKKEARHAEQR